MISEVNSEKRNKDRTNELEAVIDDFNSSSDRGSVSMRIDSGVSLQEAMQKEFVQQEKEKHEKLEKAKIIYRKKHVSESR